MFSEIPKLFDKHFAIGYLIPSAALLIGLQGLLSAFRIASLPSFLTDTNPIIGSAIIGLLAWLLGVVLAATNRDLIRFLEGYGSLNPLVVFLPLQKAKFNSLEAKIKELEDKNPNRNEKEEDKLNELFQEQVTYFPDQEKWLLPTSFGNTIRAFEVYPRLMYGVDSIALWPRLLTVIPDGYRVYIDDAKANMDFWINLGVSTWILLLSSIGMRVYDHYKKIPVNELLFWTLIGFEILFIVICQYRTKQSAVGWGQTVKSAFDVHLPDLATKLGLKMSEDREAQRLAWENYGVAILYARSDFLPELKKVQVDSAKPTDEGFLAKFVKFLFGDS